MRYTLFDTPILSHLGRFVSWIFLRTLGWRISGQLPDLPKYVLAGGPHTTNWDFPFMVAFAFALRLRPHWMGKDSLFTGVFRPILIYLGGVPIDRSRPTGMVEQTIEALRESDRLVILIAPEGTRKKTDGWKSGFYHIAHGAGVPLVLGYLDYDKKIGGIGPTLTLTGDIKSDMAVVRDFFADITPKYPDQASPPRIEL